ncbi:MAG: TadE/TadG family type IV pilus assembly protein [Terracidiphilus sp.]
MVLESGSRPQPMMGLVPARTLERATQHMSRSIFKRMGSAFARDVQGGALVEMAVSMPVILLLMTGIFSFSIALHQKLALAEAVSAGGRVLAVERGDTDPCKATTNAIYAAAPTLSQSNMTINYVLNGVAVGSGVTTCASTPNLVTGGTAQITATYPTSVSVFGRNLGTFNLATTITEVVQ